MIWIDPVSAGRTIWATSMGKISGGSFGHALATGKDPWSEESLGVSTTSVRIASWYSKPLIFPEQLCMAKSSVFKSSGRSGVAERKIQPLLRDQCLAGQFGPLRQNVRAIPRAVLAWLAAHGFQPDLVCKSHWTAGKVGVRAHGAWDHEMFARDL